MQHIEYESFGLLLSLDFQITQTDDVIHFVCVDCWSRTQTFHSFYKAIEITHRNFFAKGIVPSKKNTIDLPAISKGENGDSTQPMVLDATLRNIETVLSEGDESCESEHFVACNDISIANDGLTNANDSFHVKINQKIDSATGTYIPIAWILCQRICICSNIHL